MIVVLDELLDSLPKLHFYFESEGYSYNINP